MSFRIIATFRPRIIQGTRLYSQKAPAATIENVKDIETFFNKIGRKAIEHKDDFETLDSFLKADSATLKNKGIDTRLRRYMLSWKHKFLQGEELRTFKQPLKKQGGERKRKEVKAKLAAQKRIALRDQEE